MKTYRNALCSVFALGLATWLGACGDDDTGGASDTTSATATTGSPSGTTSNGSTSTTGSTSSTGGGGSGGGGNNDAEAFCNTYDTKCEFGGIADATDHPKFEDDSACLAGYGEFTEAQLTCVGMHLGMADGPTSIHCWHATGEGPCAPQ